MKYILPPCGQSTDYPHFFISFSNWHIPRNAQPCVAWLTVFREKSRLEIRTSVPQGELAIPLPFPPAWSVP